jgi:hypothetical protein
MAVIVDSRWQPVPPGGAPAGPESVDYLQPGGIYRDVTLRVVPEVFLADVFVKPVLGPGRSVQVQATIDAAAVPAGPVRLTAELRDSAAVLSTASALPAGPGWSRSPPSTGAWAGPRSGWRSRTPGRASACCDRPAPVAGPEPVP